MSHDVRVRITNPTGLHARPAVKLAQLAARFGADVQVRVGDEGHWVKARSTARLMKLKARSGSELHFRAAGDDAVEALDALAQFVRRDFDENPATASADAAPADAAVADTGSDEVMTDEGVLDSNSVAGGEEIVLPGAVGAPGLARGPVYYLPEIPRASARTGTPVEELERFQAAVATAVGQLEELVRLSEVTAAEIVAFQIELLRDEEFLTPAIAAIRQGRGATQAWLELLESEIRDYTSATDEYFRARVADLKDLRDRVRSGLIGRDDLTLHAPVGAVLIADEVTPTSFLELRNRLAAVAMRSGSATSHVAILARACGLPLLVRVEDASQPVAAGTEAIVSATGPGGLLVVRPTRSRIDAFEALQRQREHQRIHSRRYLARSARTADGVTVKVYVNVDNPVLLGEVDPAHCDGIGLTRTEFMFHGGGFPDEETQYRIYRNLLQWAAGRPVTIRTLDAGGDKPISGLTVDGEQNPFLGLRGVRLSLARREIFEVQLRALARAAAHGTLKVMVPMVTVPEELEQVRALLRGQVQALRGAGVEAAVPSLGMMVEVPAAALNISAFTADFLSIGTNDLVQYLMAAGRDNSAVAHLQDCSHPAVLELISRVVSHAADVNREVSVCGEMAAMPDALPTLLECGVKVLSVPPAALAEVKAFLASHTALSPREAG